MNFYDLNEQKHLKTVPVMDELEGVVILDYKHSRELLSAEEYSSRGVVQHPEKKKRGRSDVSADDSFVVITGGLKGVIRIFKISIEVFAHLLLFL